MKTALICRKTALLALCLSTAVTVFAGGGKEVIKTGKALAQTQRPGTVQRFVYSPRTFSHIRQGILGGKLDHAVAAQRTLVTPQAKAAADADLPDNNILFKTRIASVPLEKEILLLMASEEAFYAPEIEAAKQIRQQIFNKKVMTPEGKNEISQAIVDHIKNPTLRTMLLNSLERFDIGSMALDLMDYFSLDKTFEQAAFDYTIRHPHRINLNMRRLMYNPLVDDGIKTRLRYFIEAPVISPESYPQFRIVLRAAHLQFQLRLSAAKQSDIIQAHAQYLQDITNRLSDFIVKNNRLPKWNTRSLNERELFDELDWLYAHKSLNNFDPLTDYWKALQTIVDSAPPHILPLQETVTLYEEFVKTTHRTYPHSVREKLKKDEIAFEQEELLWDSLEHWRIQNERKIRLMLQEILNKYMPK